MKCSTRVFAFLSLVLAIVAVSGCIWNPNSTAGGAAIVASGTDAVEVYIPRPLDHVYEIAVSEVNDRGRSVNRDPEFYRFEGEVENRRLWIQASPEDSETTLLRVRARKIVGTVADLTFARRFASAIVLRAVDTPTEDEAEGEEGGHLHDEHPGEEAGHSEGGGDGHDH